MTSPLRKQLEEAYRLIQNERLDEAQTLLKSFLSRNPDYPDGWWLLANAVTEPRQAFEALKTLLRLKPDHEEGLEAYQQLLVEYPEFGLPATPVPGEIEDFSPDISVDIDDLLIKTGNLRNDPLSKPLDSTADVSGAYLDDLWTSGTQGGDQFADSDQTEALDLDTMFGGKESTDVAATATEDEDLARLFGAPPPPKKDTGRIRPQTGQLKGGQPADEPFGAPAKPDTGKLSGRKDTGKLEREQKKDTGRLRGRTGQLPASQPADDSFDDIFATPPAPAAKPAPASKPPQDMSSTDQFFASFQDEEQGGIEAFDLDTAGVSDAAFDDIFGDELDATATMPATAPASEMPADLFAELAQEESPAPSDNMESELAAFFTQEPAAPVPTRPQAAKKAAPEPEPVMLDDEAFFREIENVGAEPGFVKEVVEEPSRQGRRRGRRGEKAETAAAGFPAEPEPAAPPPQRERRQKPVRIEPESAAVPDPFVAERGANRRSRLPLLLLAVITLIVVGLAYLVTRPQTPAVPPVAAALQAVETDLKNQFTLVSSNQAGSAVTLTVCSNAGPALQRKVYEAMDQIAGRIAGVRGEVASAQIQVVSCANDTVVLYRATAPIQAVIDYIDGGRADAKAFRAAWQPN